MREVIRRVIDEIRDQRRTFEAKPKVGYGGELNDLVTTADGAAQEICIRLLKEWFPGYGIVAEEDGLQVPSSRPDGTYFTVDPLDGTKAFARKQSHGVGTMLALVASEEVIAVVIGDVMTQEIYYYRPDSNKVHRISEFKHEERLLINPNQTLLSQYVLLRDIPQLHSEGAQKLLTLNDDGSLPMRFRGISVANGSIGISMAQVWKGEVGAAVLNPGYRTPWDETPILGISHKLGFVFLKIDSVTGALELIDIKPPTKTTKVDYEVLVVHESRLEELGL
jgi:fructose-1,6-bisphosphatase/inositol monophosphatase family enzyme